LLPTPRQAPRSRAASSSVRCGLLGLLGSVRLARPGSVRLGLLGLVGEQLVRSPRRPCSACSGRLPARSLLGARLLGVLGVFDRAARPARLARLGSVRSAALLGPLAPAHSMRSAHSVCSLDRRARLGSVRSGPLGGLLAPWRAAEPLRAPVPADTTHPAQAHQGVPPGQAQADTGPPLPHRAHPTPNTGTPRPTPRAPPPGTATGPLRVLLRVRYGCCYGSKTASDLHRYGCYG